MILLNSTENVSITYKENKNNEFFTPFETTDKNKLFYQMIFTVEFIFLPCLMEERTLSFFSVLIIFLL